MIRDREMVIDALQSGKVDTVSFTQAAIETSDPNLKQTLKQIRDQVENSHDQAFQIASQHGWYEGPAPANPQEIQRLKNRFSQVGGPVGVGQWGAGAYGVSQQPGVSGQLGQYSGQQFHPSHFGPQSGQQYGPGQYGVGSYGTSGTPQSTQMSQPTGQAGQSGRTYGQQYPGSGSQMGTTSQYGGGQFGQQYPGSGFQQSWNPASPQSGGTYSPGRTSI